MTGPSKEALAALRNAGCAYIKCDVRLSFSPDPDTQTVSIYVFDPAVKREPLLENWYKRTYNYPIKDVRDDLVRAMLKRYRLIAFELCEGITVDAKLEILKEPLEFDTTDIVAVSPYFAEPLSGVLTSFREYHVLQPRTIRLQR